MMDTVRLDFRWGSSSFLCERGEKGCAFMCCLGVMEADTGTPTGKLIGEEWPSWCKDDYDDHTLDSGAMLEEINSVNLNARKVWVSALERVGFGKKPVSKEFVRLNCRLEQTAEKLKPLMHELREYHDKTPVTIEFVPVTMEQFEGALEYYKLGMF